MTVEWKDAEIIARVRAAAMSAVIEMAEKVRETANLSMSAETKTGRIYRRRVASGTYQASAPGEPPAVDTASLVQSLRVESEPEDLKATVFAGSALAPYAAALEFGTPKIAPRPFMRPALERNREEIERTVTAAVRGALAR